jgi:glycosyltransferase involved in cell wall biosynthesis
LVSIAKQDYPNLEVIVGDDCSPDPEVSIVAEEVLNELPCGRLVRREKNLGLILNALSLRDEATGKYFLWLADDDEISPNYISSLVRELERDPSAVTAMGHRIDYAVPGRPTAIDTSYFPQSNSLIRYLRFVWKTDDAFFYGVHRRDALQQCQFSDFWWPNAGSVMNWCYILIADLVLQGKILRSDDPTVVWSNHDYTEKQYGVTRFGLSAILGFAVRRINVHATFLRKAGRRFGAWAPLLLLPVSIASLIREALALAPQLPRRLTRPSPMSVGSQG